MNLAYSFLVSTRSLRPIDLTASILQARLDILFGLESPPVLWILEKGSNPSDAVAMRSLASRLRVIGIQVDVVDSNSVIRAELDRLSLSAFHDAMMTIDAEDCLTIDHGCVVSANKRYRTFLSDENGEILAKVSQKAKRWDNVSLQSCNVEGSLHLVGLMRTGRIAHLPWYLKVQKRRVADLEIRVRTVISPVVRAHANPILIPSGYFLTDYPNGTVTAPKAAWFRSLYPLLAELPVSPTRSRVTRLSRYQHVFEQIRTKVQDPLDQLERLFLECQQNADALRFIEFCSALVEVCRIGEAIERGFGGNISRSARTIHQAGAEMFDIRRLGEICSVTFESCILAGISTAGLRPVVHYGDIRKNATLMAIRTIADGVDWFIGHDKATVPRLLTLHKADAKELMKSIDFLLNNRAIPSQDDMGDAVKIEAKKYE